MLLRGKSGYGEYKLSEIFSRNELYWGKDFQDHLKTLKICVFGLGGVGGFALEALARAGIENFLIVDFDTISKSNINRQLVALQSTVGLKKTEVFYKRLKDINPNINVEIFDDFFDASVLDAVFKERPYYVVDAIDTLKSKIELIKYSKENNINIISSLGAGNRMDASKLYVADISELKYKDCFIKNVLSKLKKYAEIEKGLTVVASQEHAKSSEKIKNIECITKKCGETIEITKFTPASTPVVPAVCGYLMANYIIQICYKSYICRSI